MYVQLYVIQLAHMHRSLVRQCYIVIIMSAYLMLLLYTSFAYSGVVHNNYFVLDLNMSSHIISHRGGPLYSNDV